MNTCPNCGFKHADTYAPELSGLIPPNQRGDVLLRLQQSNGALVTVDKIIEFLWEPNEQPKTARDMVQIYISRINVEIEPFGWMVISMRNRGYRLMRIAA